MTIEDGLEELEDKKKKPEPEKSGEKPTGHLLGDARQVMGGILVKYFTGGLAQQNTRQIISGSTKEIVQKYGLDMFSITPDSGNNVHLIKSSTSLNDNIPDEIMKEVLKTICGEYALETDLAEYAGRDRIDDLSELIPEFKRFLKETVDVEYSVTKNRAILNPYIIVMDMSDSLRPLAVMAVKKAADRQGLRIPDEKITGTQESILRPAIDAMTPDAKDYSDAAKEYGIKQVVPVIKEFKRVGGLYIDRWSE